MRNVPRYRDAFKLRVVEDAAGGKYASLNEALRRRDRLPNLVPGTVSASGTGLGRSKIFDYKPLCYPNIFSFRSR
jgi:hypothetical protein